MSACTVSERYEWIENPRQLFPYPRSRKFTFACPAQNDRSVKSDESWTSQSIDAGQNASIFTISARRKRSNQRADACAARRGNEQPWSVQIRERVGDCAHSSNRDPRFTVRELLRTEGIAACGAYDTYIIPALHKHTTTVFGYSGARIKERERVRRYETRDVQPCSQVSAG